jgi:hypothetical protein
MSTSTITLSSGTSYTLVTPANGLDLTTAGASVALTQSDNVGAVTNPFTQQTQTQTWAGGDLWKAQLTLPPMNRAQAAPWLAFLGALRGGANVFQLGYGPAVEPLGNPQGSPVVAAAAGAMATSLTTSGWTPNAENVLLYGDFFQVGYRLHIVLDDAVSADGNGNATFNIWPSIREPITANAAITTSNPVGLFRLATNDRTWHFSPNQLTTLSINAVEAR